MGDDKLRQLGLLFNALGALGLDSLQKHRRGPVVGILGDELTLEIFLEIPID